MGRRRRGLLLTAAGCGEAPVPDDAADAPETAREREAEPPETEEPAALWWETEDGLTADVEDELTRKGWSRIARTEGAVDQWGGCWLEADGEEGLSVLCTISGQVDGRYDNPITVFVPVALDPETGLWKRQRAFYVSEAGREMDAESEEILAAADAELWDYMYSY